MNKGYTVAIKGLQYKSYKQSLSNVIMVSTLIYFARDDFWSKNGFY